MPNAARSSLRTSHRSWGLFALVALSTALIPAGPSSGAPAATPSPVVRQIATWSSNGVDGTARLVTVLRDSGASIVRTLPVASAVVIDVPATWRSPAGVQAAQDQPMQVAGSSDYAPRDSSKNGAGGDGAKGGAAGGAGITVAVVDTGVADVSDLRGSVEHVNVSGSAPGDGYGHGTFLAGVIAASGEASSGQYAGIAPAANILDVKVAKADGSTSLLRVLAGLQAVADRARHDDSLRVVNLSLSAGEPGAAGLDPLSRAIEALASRGLVVVVSAGNDGPSDGTVTVPGTEPAAITVGALDDLGSDTRADDVVAGFSSRGTAGDTESKPDLVASGVKVIGLRAPGSVIDTEHPGGRVGTANFRGSGTSMSTALTSGAVANLLAALPDLDPDDVKLALAQSAYAVPGGLTAAGSGGLEPAAAAAAGRRILAEQAASSSEAVATAYEQFPAAWRSGSQAEATAAWLQLPLSLRRELARDWAGSGDLGAGWLSRSWASRSWAADDWVSRSWASRSWASRSWASRSWASRSWASRSWAADDWASRSWVSRSWASRSWAADDWASRSWASRSWAASAWGPDAQ